MGTFWWSESSCLGRLVCFVGHWGKRRRRYHSRACVFVTSPPGANWTSPLHNFGKTQKWPQQNTWTKQIPRDGVVILSLASACCCPQRLQNETSSAAEEFSGGLAKFADKDAVKHALVLTICATCAALTLSHDSACSFTCAI